MKNIRILHCIQSLAWGGLELYTAELITQLSKTDIQQWVLCSAQSKIAENLKGKNIQLILFDEAKLSKLALSRRIRSLCREHQITHLQSHTRLDMWACGLARWNQTTPAHIYNLYMNALPKKDFVHRWLYSKVDAVCSSSEFVLQEAKKNWPIDPRKLHLMRYGRQAEIYNSAPVVREHLRSMYSIPNSEMVFGTLCRIDPGKGVQDLVKALDYLSDEEIKKMHLMIIGDPTIRGKGAAGETIFEEESLALSAWIKSQCQNPRFKDHLHYIPFQKEYVPYLDLLDIYILASYNETYSLSVLDAMLMSKPVIGTDAGGTTEQIGHNERGFLVPPMAPEKIAEAFRYYIQHPEKIAVQGDAGRQWVLSQHDWQVTLANTINLYQRLAQP